MSAREITAEEIAADQPYADQFAQWLRHVRLYNAIVSGLYLAGDRIVRADYLQLAPSPIKTKTGEHEHSQHEGSRRTP
jgi:hypothetical protein